MNHDYEYVRLLPQSAGKVYSLGYFGSTLVACCENGVYALERDREPANWAIVTTA